MNFKLKEEKKMKTKTLDKRSIFLVGSLIILLTFANCAYAIVIKECADVRDKEESGELAKCAPGEVIVKLKERKDPAALRTESYFATRQRNESILSTLKSKYIDYNLEVKGPVFKGLHDRLAKSNLTLAQLESETITRFPGRADRRPKDAKSVNLLPIYLLKTDRDVSETCDLLNANPHVEYAEPNYIMEVQMIPDDPYYHSSGSWGQSYDDLWGLKPDKLNCEAAWDISQGDGIVVAVIDTGVDYTHEDLAANMWANPGEIPDNGVDDDGNGYVDDLYGYNFAYDDNDPMDRYGHGSHCAGTIAAVGNNGIGLIGVAPMAKVMAVKGIGDNGRGFYSDAVESIVYSADNGADILSNSWGGTAESQAMTDAFHYAYSLGCVSIAAAGNSNSNVNNFLPAKIDTVIAVAASDHNDERSIWSRSHASNYGCLIDLAAPGGGDPVLAGQGSDLVSDILSTMSDSSSIAEGRPNLKVSDAYWRLAGTSMACPHVSGVAALIISAHPDFTNDEVRSALKVTAEPVTTSHYIGQGRINAHEAVAMESAPPVAFLTTAGTVRGNIMIEGTAKGEDFDTYSLYFGEGKEPETWFLLEHSSVEVDNGVLHQGFETRNLEENKSYMLRLTAADTLGRVVETHSMFVVDNRTILSPMNNDVLNPTGIINIEGELWPDIEGYTIEYGVGFDPDVWSDSGITLINGNGPILAEWDTSTITENDFYNLRLRVDFPFGTREYRVLMFYFDTRLKSGWPQYIPVNDPLNYCWQDTEVFDLDNDGYKEIIVAEGGSYFTKVGTTLMVYRCDGTLWWSRNTGSELSDGRMAIGDIDDDGFGEIFIDGANTSLFNYEICGFNYDGTGLAGWPVVVPSTMHSFVIADLNGDGANELIANSFCSTMLYVFDMSGNILLQKDLPEAVNSKLSHQSIAIGNFDEDSDLEIVTRYDADGLAIYNMDGTLVPGWPIQLGCPRVPSTPATGDLDNDGFDEIVIAIGKWPDPNAGIYAYDRNGNLLPGWPVLDYLSEGYIFEQESVALADIDGDGDLEIAVPGRLHSGEFSSSQFVFHHTGDVVCGWPQIIPGRLNLMSSNVIADIDADGHLDIILSTGGISRYTLSHGSLGLNGGIWAWNRDGMSIDLNSEEGISCIFMEQGKFISRYGVYPERKSPPVITDLDNDGMLEIVASSRQDAAYLPETNSFVPKGRSTVYVWELGASYDPLNAPWPTFQHDPQHTGRYGEISDEIELYFDPEPQDQSVDEGDTLSFTVHATGPSGATIKYLAVFYEEERDIDLDGDIDLDDFFIIVGATGTQEGDPGFVPRADLAKPYGVINISDVVYFVNRLWKYPEGVSFDDQTGLFEWDTNYDQEGDYSVTLSAYVYGSEELNISETIIITINNVRPPEPPSRLIARPISSTRINLYWRDNSDNEYGFKVERRLAEYRTYWQEIAVVDNDITEYNDEGLKPATAYEYRVRAYNEAGNSKYSNIAGATTGSSKNTPPEILYVRNYWKRYLVWLGRDKEDGYDVKYSYRIDGGKWSYPSRRRWLAIRYLRLKRGNHIFEVKAIDKEGLESIVKSIKFRK